MTYYYLTGLYFWSYSENTDHGLTAIDIIVDRLPSKYKRIVMILNYFITLVINVLVIWGFNLL